MTDLQDRRERLDEFLAREGCEAVWLARPNSFAWLTGGSNVVDRDADLGVAAAGYDGEFRVVTDNIEAERLADEELPDAFTVESTAWYESGLGEAVADRTPTPALADFPVPAEDVTEFDASTLRQPLSENDVQRYRDLGTAAANAVESVCRELQSGDTEIEVAAGIRISLSAQDVETPVALAGGAERARQYRHYTPTTSSLGEYALVSITAERGGLYASCTRTVAFDPPEWLAERHQSAMQIETDALAATRRVAREGGTASDVFADVRAAYDRAGWPEEWRNHHQGGAAGYAGREWFASPDAENPVQTPMAYAWNPTVQGAKSEDTVLVTDDGFEVLTATGDWPSVEVSPDESVVGDGASPALTRHEILSLGE
ncbi:M24 family metallopeptidase [Salinirubrum litoreum]|uniref:M24 family metallopeptidase n=1 Tax=Salinirubrum litoreum TaxID=1126234 RepID=A0ABD5R8E7_9EURY|nr:M24 family metallopeptidase [Salinirubrum litoreum]